MFTKGLPAHITGGMETHVESLVNGLIRRKHEVTITTATRPKRIKKEKKEIWKSITLEANQRCTPKSGERVKPVEIEFEQD